MPPKRKKAVASAAKRPKASNNNRRNDAAANDDNASLSDGELDERSFAARDAALAGVGTMESDVIARMFPMPGTVRSVRTVRGANGLVLQATGGHADGFDREAPLGCGVELFAMDDAPQLAATKPGFSLAQAGAHIYQAISACNELAPGLRDMIAKYGSRSYEVLLPDDTFQFVGVDRARWTHPETGRTGLLLTPAVNDGVGPTPLITVDGVPGDIMMVCVRLLTVAELDAIVKGGPSARNDVVQRLSALGARQQLCSLSRPCMYAKADDAAPPTRARTRRQPPAPKSAAAAAAPRRKKAQVNLPVALIQSLIDALRRRRSSWSSCRPCRSSSRGRTCPPACRRAQTYARQNSRAAPAAGCAAAAPTCSHRSRPAPT